MTRSFHRWRWMDPALAAVLALSSAGRAQDYLVVDGLWVDLLPDSAERRFDAGMPELVTPLEALQRGVAAMNMTREYHLTSEDLDQATQCLRRAEAHIRAGEWTRAFLELRDGLAINPNHPGLLSRAAMVSMQKREYDRAERYFARFLELRPNDLPHIVGRVEALLRLTRLEEAEEWIERGMSLDSQSLALRFHRACLRLIREQPLDDQEYWRRRSLEELYLLGTWLTSQHDDLERMLGAADERKLAEHVLGPAIAARLPEAMQILTAVLQGRKDSRYTEARTTLETVRQWGADQFGILAALADLLVLEGRHEEGLHLWADAVAKYKDWPQSWLSYGIQLLRADRAKEAVTAFQEGRRLAPDETVLRFVLACALARAGETQQAQALFDEVVQTHATAARAWMESDPVLERALRSVPNSPNYLRVMNIPPESE